MKPLAVLVAALAVAAVVLLACRPPAADGSPTTVPADTTTTVTVPLAPLPDDITVAAPAVRHTAVQLVEPPTPPTTVLVFADDCTEMSWYRQQAGLPARFDGIGWRESRCRNEDQVRTFCCYGWWQLYVSLHLRDHRLVDAYHACGVYSHDDVNSNTPADKQRVACATKALYDEMGYAPWKATA